MDARSILARLRHGQVPDRDALDWFAKGLAGGDVSAAQAGAFAMGICAHPLGAAGRVDLTLAMRDSGEVLNWDLPGPVLDKHSTGGVGDCVSMMLAPAMAALGAYVPMISGRGLGHTGGTLDKLESIPGLSTEVDADRFAAITRDAGCAIVAASKRVAPADRALYAVRDVTGTVDSIDLITASILSKKLAAGLEALVLDVKLGSGAFMKDMEAAEGLARALVDTANGAGLRTTALITDMGQPPALAIGNALEIMEVMIALTDGDAQCLLSDLTAELGGEMACLAGMAHDRDEGAEMVRGVIASGAAAERFGRMVAAMGGPRDFVDRWRDRLPSAPVAAEVVAPESGHVAAMDGEALGMAVVALGGGRRVAGDRIDPSVGLSDVAMPGDAVAKGESLAIVHAATDEQAQAAVAACAAAFRIAATPPDLPPLILQKVS